MAVVENILNIQTTFKKNENEKIIEINNLKYKKYYVFSPNVSTFWNVDNVSPALNNNKIECFIIPSTGTVNQSTGFFNRTVSKNYNYGQKNLPIVYNSVGRKNIKILPDSEISPRRPIQPFDSNELNVINSAQEMKITPVTSLTAPGVIIPNIFYRNEDFGIINNEFPYRYEGSVCFTPSRKNSTNRFLTFKSILTLPHLSGMIVYEYDDYGIAVKNRVALTYNDITGTFTTANEYNYGSTLNNNYFNKLLSIFGESYAIFPQLTYRFLLFFNLDSPFPSQFNNNLYMKDIFKVGLSPYKLTDNCFNLTQNKYYLTKSEFCFRSFTLSDAYYTLGTTSRYALLINLLLPSFSSNQTVINTSMTFQGTPTTLGVSRCSYLFDMKPPLTGIIWNIPLANGNQKAFDNFNLLMREINNLPLTEDQFYNNYLNGETKIYQSNGTEMTVRTAFNIPVNGANCLITVPFIPTSELIIKKSSTAASMKVTLYQITTTSGTNNMFNNITNLKMITFKMGELSTKTFSGIDYPTAYFKFIDNILLFFNCAKLIRLVDTTDITNQIGPVFLSDTEMIFYGLNTTKTYKFAFEYTDSRGEVDNAKYDVILMSYLGTQNLEVIKKVELTENKYESIPYNTSSFCIIQFENFTRTNNNIDGLLITAGPDNFLTSDDISIVTSTSLIVITQNLNYTREQFKAVRYSLTGELIAIVNFDYVVLNLETNKYDYYFPLPILLAATILKTSIIDYNQSFTNSTFTYINSNTPKKTIEFPTGWYSGIDAVNFFIQQLKALTLLTDITFDQFTNKLTILNSTTDSIRLLFTTPTSTFQESSALIYGFNTPSFILPPATKIITPFEMDFYFNGRFSQVKINLLNFSNFGFLNESLTLIKLVAKDKKGTLSQNQVVNFIKMLPPNIVLSNLSFQVVDNRNLLVNFNESIDLEFLIRCVND